MNYILGAVISGTTALRGSSERIELNLVDEIK